MLEGLLSDESPVQLDTRLGDFICAQKQLVGRIFRSI